jgi:NAD dependent epimerase/dehydratase family enzyme
VIQNQVEGVVNAVAPIPVSNQELTSIIAKRLHRPLFLPNLPRSFMKMVLGEMHILLFNNKNVVPKKVVNLGFKFDYPTAEIALSHLIK